jgi:tetratricopeptide (TPR) repeat protein
VAQTLYLRGVIHQNRNQSGNALLDYEAAAALQRRLGQDRGEAAALEQAATVLQALNRSDEAVDHFVASGVSLARVAASLRPAAEFVTYRGFREALRTGHYGAAERALRGLQNLNVPELQLLHDRAQLLGQSDDPGAEQIYSRLLEQSRSLTPDLQEHFRLVVDSGRLRQRLRGTFGGCPGVVVVRRAILPESADALLHGDILLRLNGECIHSAGYLRPILESSRVDQGLALQILRRGILRTLTLPKDWLKVQVVPF